ncbi:MAG: hypothetical protein IJA67_08650 [Oscillospiraceae bacterium]|nr:hypothetical protein [Oscillospiraceae bacterium]
MPQNRFAGLADCTAKSGDGTGCVEIKDVQKVLMDKVFFRGQTTAGHQDISGADRRRIAERNLYVIIIILFQKRICNDTENVIVVVVPVFSYKTGGDLFKLIGKAAFCRYIKAAFQSRCYGILMLLPVFPKKRAAGVFSAAGVRYIEYIF